MVFVVMPVMSIVVATVGLLDGASLTLQLHRVEPRIIEEVLETSGNITRPVERVVQEGRVDVTATRRILGLFLLSETRLYDVVEVGGSSGTRRVKDRSSGRTTTYSAGAVELVTRGGDEWISPTISHAIGHSPEEMREQIEKFIDDNASTQLTLRSMPWLSNVIGLPFVFVALLMVFVALRRAAELLGLRATKA